MQEGLANAEAVHARSMVQAMLKQHTENGQLACLPWHPCIQLQHLETLGMACSSCQPARVTSSMPAVTDVVTTVDSAQQSQEKGTQEYTQTGATVAQLLIAIGSC